MAATSHVSSSRTVCRCPPMCPFYNTGLTNIDIFVVAGVPLTRPCSWRSIYSNSFRAGTQKGGLPDIGSAGPPLDYRLAAPSKTAQPRSHRALQSSGPGDPGP